MKIQILKDTGAKKTEDYEHELEDGTTETREREVPDYELVREIECDEEQADRVKYKAKKRAALLEREAKRNGESVEYVVNSA